MLTGVPSASLTMMSRKPRKAPTASTVASVGEPLPSSIGGQATPLWLTPTQVRKFATCGMARVTVAIRSSELPATTAKPVRGTIGGKVDYVWWIKAEDARAWAERVERERVGMCDDVPAMA